MASLLSPQEPRDLAPIADEDLELLLLIRHFERTLLELFGQGVLSGTTHTCLGQEYVPVALRTLLHAGDFVFSNHRGIYPTQRIHASKGPDPIGDRPTVHTWMNRRNG